MTKYEHSEQVKAIAEELIAKLPELKFISEAAPSIAYMESDQEKKSHGGRIFADCEKVKPKMREFMNYDYVITVYTRNCIDFTVNQWKILIYHELLHIDCERYSDGELQCRIRPHDIQDFHEVIDKFGTYWAEDPEVGDILEGIESV